MSCREFDDNQVLLYAYGELEPEVAERLKAHLAECENCRRALREIESLRSLVRDPLMPAEPSLIAIGKVKRKAMESVSKPGILKRLILPGPFPVPRLAWGAAAALVVVVVISVFIVSRELRERRLAYDFTAFNEMIALLAEEEKEIFIDVEGEESETESYDMLAALGSMEEEYNQFGFNGGGDEVEPWQRDWDELEEDFRLLDEYFKTL